MIQTNYFWFQPNGNPRSTHVFISLKNLDARTIKYCTFAFTGYNAVGDIINWKSDKQNAILQIVGPIGPDACAECTFESVWYSTIKVCDLKLVIAYI